MNVCITFCELKILRCMDQQNAVSTKTHQTNGQWYIQLPCCELFQLYSLFFVCVVLAITPRCNTLLDAVRFGANQLSSDVQEVATPSAFRCVHRCCYRLELEQNNSLKHRSFPNGRFYLKLKACATCRLLFILTLLFS